MLVINILVISIRAGFLNQQLKQKEYLLRLLSDYLPSLSILKPMSRFDAANYHDADSLLKGE
jgi:hypothetical protein